jgi:hypothetical protein
MRLVRALAFVALGALLSACAGGAVPSGVSPGAQAASEKTQAVAATATSTPAPAPTLPATLNISQGLTYGKPGMFTPKRGDTARGGRSQTVDGIPCLPTMTENEFHVHSYLGLIVNGQWYAIPNSIGMYQPGAPDEGYVNTATCFYEIHTHDGTGYIHQEVASSTPLSDSMFTLGNLMDVWGQPISDDSFGPFTGTVEIFTAQAPSGSLYASGYTAYTGEPSQLALYSHLAIWVEVGPPYVAPADLPTVRFYTMY